MNHNLAAAELWDGLTSFSDTYTCYSSAIATWVAWDREDWRQAINPGLWLTVTSAHNRLFGFAHFPPNLRRRLGLVRTGADEEERAMKEVLVELKRSERVIVAGDGFRLPWHVAYQRRHVPHWYVLADAVDGPTVVDPFACRNELGVQTASNHPVSRGDLPRLLAALPGDDPVLTLRESLAFGDDAGAPDGRHYQWFVVGEPRDVRAPTGARGPDAVLRLARHFRDHGQDLEAYAQTDDIWSIGRHRAFLARHAAVAAEKREDPGLAQWVQEHGEPLAKRWSHMAPLLMQAILSLRSGRTASPSVPDTLERLAEMEAGASSTAPESFIERVGSSS